MSEQSVNTVVFQSAGTVTGVKLPFDLDAMVQAWSSLRTAMIREIPDGFTRDEWAYLISFMSSESLNGVYESTFGKRLVGEQAITETLTIRDNVALWLPNNVSLLGPLVMILVSITGSALHVKIGSRSENLCEVLSQWALTNTAEGPLKSWLENKLVLMRIGRGDPRLKRLSQWANIKMAFGSDSGCRAIADLPSRPDAINFSFSDKQSRIWCLKEELTDDVIQMIIKVFSIYGRAGCTSPQCLTILDGTEADCLELAERLTEYWPKTIRKDVEMHIASDNVLSLQLARAKQWNAWLVARNKAVISVGPADAELPSGHLHLPISGASLDEATAALPDNIQTIGFVMSEARQKEVAEHLEGTQVKRFVPVEQMHHFGPVWDGMEFWKALFCEESSHDQKTRV
ncbi:MAG: acyl-CoA reductase [Polyangiaceae bacterium]|nr:acyl-CoA reductase [Polyangiaceae bacterium]